MLSTTIFATLMAFAAAVPQGGPSVKTGDICGNGQIICCNDQSITNKLTAASILSDLDFRNLLSGGQCSPLHLNLPVLPNQKNCQQNSVCCGHNKQAGVINVGCVPISLIN
ncbi:hypothetical protein MY10362_004122 [Beauveria mimosiformis]